jgi:uncharacterized protein YlxP (DUF503 family)
MVIGLCTIELYLPTVHSLKAKRSILKGVIQRVRHEFNVSIAEVDHQDAWQSAVVDWIQDHRLDVELVDFQIEML